MNEQNYCSYLDAITKEELIEQTAGEERSSPSAVTATNSSVEARERFLRES